MNKLTILAFSVIAISLSLVPQVTFGQVNNNTQYCKDLVKNGIGITNDPICGNNVEKPKQRHPCVAYDSPALIIIDMRCAGINNPLIAYYVSQGYEIKTATDNTIYLQKEIVK